MRPSHEFLDLISSRPDNEITFLSQRGIAMEKPAMEASGMNNLVNAFKLWSISLDVATRTTLRPIFKAWAAIAADAALLARCKKILLSLERIFSILFIQNKRRPRGHLDYLSINLNHIHRSSRRNLLHCPQAMELQARLQIQVE